MILWMSGMACGWHRGRGYGWHRRRAYGWHRGRAYGWHRGNIVPIEEINPSATKPATLTVMFCQSEERSTHSQAIIDPRPVSSLRQNCPLILGIFSTIDSVLTRQMRLQTAGFTKPPCRILSRTSISKPGNCDLRHVNRGPPLETAPWPETSDQMFPTLQRPRRVPQRCSPKGSPERTSTSGCGSSNSRFHHSATAATTSFCWPNTFSPTCAARQVAVRKGSLRGRLPHYEHTPGRAMSAN